MFYEITSWRLHFAAAQLFLATKTNSGTTKLKNAVRYISTSSPDILNFDSAPMLPKGLLVYLICQKISQTMNGMVPPTPYSSFGTELT